MILPQDLALKDREILTCSVNARSARANKPEINDFISTCEPHVLAVQETWGFDTRARGYKCLSNHREKRGGGVSITLKSELKLKLDFRQSDANIEIIVVSNSDIIICNLYRQPKGNIPSFCNELKKILTNYQTEITYHKKWEISILTF